MKLFRKDFQIWKNEIYLLPTIKVCINNPVYAKRNLSLEVHFLVFNARLLWLEDNVKN